MAESLNKFKINNKNALFLRDFYVNEFLNVNKKIVDVWNEVISTHYH